MTLKSLPRPSEKPWLTIIIHDTDKPHGWVDVLDALIEAGSMPASLHRTELIIERREEVTS